MDVTRKVTGDVLVSEELANQIIDGLSKIVDAATTLGDAVLTLTVKAPEVIAPPPPPAAVEPRVWATDEVSLREYDAEQLVALRADHRGDNHDPEGCAVCAALAQRLGSL